MGPKRELQSLPAGSPILRWDVSLCPGHGASGLSRELRACHMPSVKVLREPSQNPRRTGATKILHPKAHSQKGTEVPASCPELSYQEPGPGSKSPSPAPAS